MLIEAKPQTIKYMLERFERKGWIEVTQQIGRLKYYGLTEAGRNYVKPKFFWTRVYKEKLLLGAELN